MTLPVKRRLASTKKEPLALEISVKRLGIPPRPWSEFVLHVKFDVPGGGLGGNEKGKLGGKGRGGLGSGGGGLLAATVGGSESDDCELGGLGGGSWQVRLHAPLHRKPSSPSSDHTCDSNGTVQKRQ